MLLMACQSRLQISYFDVAFVQGASFVKLDFFIAWSITQHQ